MERALQSVEGTSALALLENLAVDPRFRGTVIYSVAPAFTLTAPGRDLHSRRRLPGNGRLHEPEWLPH